MNQLTILPDKKNLKEYNEALEKVIREKKQDIYIVIQYNEFITMERLLQQKNRKANSKNALDSQEDNDCELIPELAFMQEKIDVFKQTYTHFFPNYEKELKRKKRK